MLSFKLNLPRFLVITIAYLFAQTAQAITFSDPTKPINVTPASSIFTLQLPANHTTGYRWFLQFATNTGIQPVSWQYHATEKNLPGAGGYETWTFRVVPQAFAIPQYTTITLVYARAWEPNPINTMQFKIYFQPVKE